MAGQDGPLPLVNRDGSRMRQFGTILCLKFVVLCGMAAGQQQVPVAFTIDNAASQVAIGLSIPGSSDSDASPVSGTLEALLDIDTTGGTANITGIEFTGGAFTNDEPFNLSLTVLGFLTADLEGTDLVGSSSTPMPPSEVMQDSADPLRFRYHAADHLLTLYDGTLTAEGAFDESVDLSEEPLSGVPPAGSYATIELVPLGMVGNLTEFGATLIQPTVFRDTFDVDAGLFDIPVTVDLSGQVLAMGAFLLDLGGGAAAGPGDYNGNGLVEQADLDLVLGNWGEDATAVGDGWINDPPQGIIDQGELDGVLANWGRSSPGDLGTATVVPEPAAIALALTSLCLCASLHHVCRRADRRAFRELRSR
jgi:hypothetical protein